jgi:hypothetical protein
MGHDRLDHSDFSLNEPTGHIIGNSNNHRIPSLTTLMKSCDHWINNSISQYIDQLMNLNHNQKPYIIYYNKTANFSFPNTIHTGTKQSKEENLFTSTQLQYHSYIVNCQGPWWASFKNQCNNFLTTTQTHLEINTSLMPNIVKTPNHRYNVIEHNL